MLKAQRIQRVALVSPYDVVQRGGVNEHVQQLAHHLRFHDVDVSILAPCSNSDIIVPGLVSLGSVVPVPINGSVAHTTLSPGIVDEVAALLNRSRFDVVHLHEPLAPMLPLSALNASQSPNVGTFHASGERSLGYAASRKPLNWLVQRLAVRIAVSEAAARFAQRYFAGEYVIIPNGVDTARFSVNVPPLPCWQDGRPTILFVGRFEEPRKGFDVLLQAFVLVQQAIPAARLLVVGSGDPQPYQTQVQTLGLHSVEFVGAVGAHQLPRYYRTADVFCAPSTGQESFGIILAEAMSSGCALVASDIDGYRQVVTHRREGLLVPPSHVDALAAALVHVLANHQVRQALAAAGPATAARYAWQDVAERVLQTYEQVQWSATAAQQPKRPRLLLSAIQLSERDIQRTAPDEETSLSSPQPKQGVTPMLTEPFEARVRTFTQRVVGRIFGNSRVTPNMLTAVGLLLTLGVTITLARGHLLLAGLLVLVTSAFDMLDGALARAREQHSPFGAFLDSTVDRYAEALIFLGLLLYYQRVEGAQFQVVMVYLAIVGSLMVSYTRARAEALGVSCKVGVLARPERIILLSLGLLTGWMTFALAVLALFTNLTAVQRVYHVWAQTEGLQRQATQRAKPQRRPWFASRDQSPS
jgi:phosphatidylinositol alpha-mannosyltransferase